MSNFNISGNYVDIFERRIFPASIFVEDGKIQSIIEEDEPSYDNFIMPGFIDSHIHIESSMLTPSEFGRIAATFGTVATVSDPHEVANVAGIDGVRFMLEDSRHSLIKIYFGAPSCVPATTFESSGASLSPEDIRFLFEKFRLKYLSEMMNFPGVIFDAQDVMEKLEIARSFGVPIDGHAPGLQGKDLEKYFSAGITTDHEAFTLEEALEKIKLGMKILIREGSAAKNFYALHSLISSNPTMCMFCSDDKHPDDLALGHINLTVKKAIALGHDLFDVLRCATLNPVEHYRLDVGLLRQGDAADFIVVSDLKDFNVIQTYVNGELVAENGAPLQEKHISEPLNVFRATKKQPSDFRIEAKGKRIRVIEAYNGELITGSIVCDAKIEGNAAVADVENDILKLTVVNRYADCAPAVAFIKGIGLKSGAFASSVAHDSHNIIAIGTNDDDLCAAVNAVIDSKGGMAVAENENIEILPLPYFGLMAGGDGYETGRMYSALDKRVKQLGSTLDAPFMTLSFMALLVIPSLKLSDKGLFDGGKFEFVGVWFPD